jgi:signal transduction histidine kinase
VRRALWLALLLLLSSDVQAQQGDSLLVTLQEAQLTATLDDGTHQSSLVGLPFHWDARFPRRNGVAEITLHFARPPLSAQHTSPYMLFFVRIASAYVIELNGAVLATAGAMDDFGAAWSAKRPVAVSFPTSLLAQDNTLVIRLRCDALRRAGLAPVMLGPVELVEPLRARLYGVRVTGAMVASILSLLVSAFCLVLWLQQRDRLYIWAAIGEAIWALLVADVYQEVLPLRMHTWDTLLIVMRLLWVAMLFFIVEEVFGRRSRRWRMFMAAVMLTTLLALLFAPGGRSSLMYGIGAGLTWLSIVLLMLSLLYQTRRNFTSEGGLLWIGISLLTTAGARDAAMRVDATMFSDPYWAKYAGSLVALSIMWIVSRRFWRARSAAEQLQASLVQRVEQKEQELRQTFEQLSAAQRSQAAAAERERILRDMHDGVGANLTAAMRQLEGGAAPPAAVAASLRDSLDHLKLSIDAMKLPAGDINALLASFRYRMQSRIEAAGVALVWDVDLLPQWPQGSDQAMRHLQFMLLEATSNVLQHAQATTLTVSAHSAGSMIVVSLRDNGRGIAVPPGRGLRSMQERAAAIGALLSVTVAQPGTQVTIQIRVAT